MKNRISKFLKVENINSSKFADEIGVQRSCISHILSGRNNPSLDLIQKILLRFDYINAEWLITGKGEMFKPKREPTLFDEHYAKNENLNEIEKTKKNETYTSENEKKESKNQTTKKNETLANPANKLPENKNILNNAKLVKIILLYEDGKAEIYIP